MKRNLTKPTAALLLVLTLGAFTPVSSGESRPTLRFANSTPATGAIEDAFKMTLDNLIGINSIPYDPDKWNDTGLLETAAESRFLRAAPSYGDNPWVHDGAYNTWSAMNLLEANDGRATHVARNTLWACCDVADGKLVVNIRQSAHSEWYMYQLWNIAAWHYYRVTGDAAFLAKAYEAATQVLAKQEAGHFNADYGLFEGSYFVGDGASGFPEPPFEPGRHSSNALQYAEVHKAMVLSTNCVYVGAYRATADMARALGRPQAEAAGWQTKADRLAAAINRRLWIPELGRYGFFIHGTGTRKAGTIDRTQEGGGLSFAILFGVADAGRTKRILENVHRQPKGITMSWPHFKRFSDEKPGRHNVSVWPQINALFAQAACIGGRIDLFQSEVENLASLFRGSGKIREIYHHLSGEHCGGFQMNSSGKISPWQAVGNQAWGAGAFSRMIYYGLFGMDFETGGIRFAPTLPAAWGEVRLGDLQYRDMTLNVTLKGEGNAIRSVEINGKPSAEPFVSGRLRGKQNVTILLDRQTPDRKTPDRTMPKATVLIDTGAPAKEYNPMIFGGFIEHFGKQIYGGFFEPGSSLADKKGFRLDVIEAIKELKVPVIRWPGGCFVDSYHWQKGVGKVRQPYDDDRWGVREPNTFGTHEFVELCRRLGAEPYICQNSLASIQEMADWVAYCNASTGKLAKIRSMNGHPEPFNVRFWSVGNEKGGRGYIDKVRDTAVAMKRSDPSIVVTCSGAHGPSAYINPYLFETAGKHLKLLSIHEYWVPNYQKHHTPDYLSCMMLSEKPNAHIGAVVKSIDKAGMRGQIKIAFDEWNLRSWHHPGFSGHKARRVDYSDPAVAALIKARDKSLDPSLYTMADALFCASFFNACLRHADDVAMANISCLVNQTGPLYVHPKGVVKRTHFHAMAMYANLLQSRVARTRVTAARLTRGTEPVAVVDAIATVDESGKKWVVAMINRCPSKEVVCTLQMGGLSIDGTYKATVLTGASPDSYNDIEHPHRVAPKKIGVTFKKGDVSLPPHSLVVVDIPLEKSPLRDEQ